jgi:5'-nucleotidase
VSEAQVPAVDGRIVVDRSVSSTGRPRALVTNDDGIDSPGIVELAHALTADFEVAVAAPDRDWSGAGTGIGRVEPGAGVSMRRVDLGPVHAFAIDGPPGLAVMAAALGAFGDPFDVVVSGVNAGINTGQSLIHSGTVGAALTARTFGSHGVAVSTEPADPWQWGAAAQIAAAVARWVVSTGREPAAFNVNVPGVPLAEVRGLRRAGLDRFGYFRVAVADERGQKIEFEVSSEHDGPPPPDSDTALLRERFATITPLAPLIAASAGLPDDLRDIWHTTG